MYLSRLVLNPRLRIVRLDLADCQAMHRRIMSAFPDVWSGAAPRAALGVLYRVETAPHTGDVVVIVQSRDEPDWSRLPAGYLQESDGGYEPPTYKPVAGQYQAIETGSRLRFRLRANPTRKIDTRSGQDGRRRNGRRVELRDEAARIDWLRRKGEQGGFDVLSVRADSGVPNVMTVPEAKACGVRSGFRSDQELAGVVQLTFAPVLFEGELKVVDAALFRKALEVGIGPGKAYGLGLLSIAPADS